MGKILVIEDSPGIRGTIVDTLEAEGFEIQSAPDGETGIELARKYSPDLIISDITMPGIDGYEVLRTLRAEDATSTTPFIFLTGNAEREDQRRGMELGADDYITKPFSPVELLAAVQTRLEKHNIIAKKHETTMEMLRRNIIYALPHEFRTPLSMILGFGEVLKMDYDELDAEEVHRMADSIVKASRRLQRLMENYLTYAQIEIISSDEERREALRNNIIADPGTIIEAQAREKATLYNRPDDLELELSNTAVRMSRDSLRKIIEELLDNAFKFSRPGSPVIVTSYLGENGDYIIYIEDHGYGMNAEQIRNIGAYMQFERTLHEQQGIGFGFVLALRVVEIHDGTIEIESIEGAGTRLRICIPR